MTDLASLLTELLLPGSLARAPERLGPRGRVWYQVGSECHRRWDQPGQAGETWSSAPATVGSVPEQQRGETWRIGDLLWDPGGARLYTARSCRPFLAVADPVANVVTLSWWWQPPDHPDVGVEDLRRLLGSRVEAFLSEARDYDRRLFQRPALHLVLIGDQPNPPSALETAVREIVARTGRFAPDVQVRWTVAIDDPAEALLRRLLGFHLPWPVWPRSSLREFTEDEISQAGQVAEDVAGSLAALSGGNHDPFYLASELEPLVNRLGTLLLDAASGGTGAAEPARRPARDQERFQVAARISVRQWHGAPLLVPLAPLTLLAGDNASGKTSVAETLNFAFTGLPRPRSSQPHGANEWRNRLGASGPDTPPSLEILRLRAGPETASSGFQEALETTELLALFADDADLAAARPGDVSVVTWLGFPGFNPATPASGRRKAGLATRLAHLFAQFESLSRGGLDRVLADPVSKRRRSGAVNLADWVLEALKGALSREIAEIESSLSAPSPPVRARTLTKQRDQLLKDQSEVATDGTEASTALLKRRIELLAQDVAHLRSWMTGAPSPWLDLRGLDEAVGGSPALQSLADQAWRDAVGELGKALEALSRRLAKRLFSGEAEKFEAEIKWFLSQRTDPTAEDDLKLNTAAVVRVGQASRLARWLSVSDVAWPLLVIDEPTLGQDEASCARALVRYLRLMRKAEAARWLAPHDVPAVSHLERIRLPDMERWSTGRVGAGRDVGDEIKRTSLGRLELGPLPPQALVLSYRASALAVVADLEGTILDHEVRTELQRLLPAAWWPVIATSLRRARQDLDAETRSLGFDLGSSLPICLLRTRWTPPVKELEERRSMENAESDWRREAEGTLARLGAHGVVQNLESSDAPFRMLAWLLQTDLLPAALVDGDRSFQVSTVSLRTLSGAGGQPTEEGPVRLRRLLPVQDELPELPTSWKEELEKVPRRETELQPAPAEPRLAPGASEPADLAKHMPREAPPERPQVERVPLTTTRRSRVWRVATEGPAAEEFPALVERVRVAVEAAGFEGAESLADADVRLHLEAREPDLGPVECRWRLEVPGGAGSEQPWEAQPSSIDRLLDALVRARVEAWASKPAGEPVEIAVATYNPRETPAANLAFRFAVDLEHEDDPGERKLRLYEVFDEGVTRLRRWLATAPATRSLRLYPRAGLSVGIRVGAVFHHASGFTVECEQNGEIWRTDGRPPRAHPVVVEASPPPPTGRPDLHVLVSVSREVRPAYAAWRSGAQGREGQVISVTPPSDPGRSTIRDSDDLLGWGAAVSEAIRAYKQDPATPVRLFVAAPAALAIAIGRQLNAHGRIIVMEWDKRTDQYFEAFDFRA